MNSIHSKDKGNFKSPLTLFVEGAFLLLVQIDVFKRTVSYAARLAVLTGTRLRLVELVEPLAGTPTLAETA